MIRLEWEFCSDCPYIKVISELLWCWHPRGISEIVILKDKVPPKWCPLKKHQLNVEGIDITQLHVGDKVRYQPSYYSYERWENGIIKEIREGVTDAVWVVYNCAGNWYLYADYTSAKTNLRDLKLGWR